MDKQIVFMNYLFKYLCLPVLEGDVFLIIPLSFGMHTCVLSPTTSSSNKEGSLRYSNMHTCDVKSTAAGADKLKKKLMVRRKIRLATIKPSESMATKLGGAP